MRNVESLDLNEHDLTPDVLAHVFQSCSKLIELCIATPRNRRFFGEISLNLFSQIFENFLFNFSNIQDVGPEFC